MYLTNKISATIAQLRFNATLPRNTNRYAQVAFADTMSMEPASIGALIIKPTAHIIGSARGAVFFKRCAIYVPNGTPIMPDVIVIAPKRNDTLYSGNNIVYIGVYKYILPQTKTEKKIWKREREREKFHNH